MLGCIQPMSSPMTNTMLGFDVACAIALVAGSADAVASAASAAPAVRVVRHKLIAISNLACRPTRLWRQSARGAPHASSPRAFLDDMAQTRAPADCLRMERPAMQNPANGEINSDGLSHPDGAAIPRRPQARFPARGDRRPRYWHSTRARSTLTWHLSTMDFTARVKSASFISSL